MRKSFTIILFLISVDLMGQIETVANGLRWPMGLVYHENYLYFVEAEIGFISKINLTEENAKPNFVGEGLIGPYYIDVYKNYIYIAENHGKRISKIDYSQPNTIPIVIYSGSAGAEDLVIHENFLYFSIFDEGVIKRIDLDQAILSPESYIRFLNKPLSLEVWENNLYFSEIGDGKISKVDLSVPNPQISIIAENLSFPSSLKIYNNQLYFWQYETSEISKINLSSDSLLVENVVSNVIVSDIEIVHGDLYFSFPTDNKIGRIKNISNKVSKQENKQGISLNPNPANEFITVTGIDKTINCLFYNGIGNLILSIQVDNNSIVDISRLGKGFYFLVFENGETKKLVIN